MNTDSEIDTKRCFICGDDNTNALQTHHIVPRRHGGTDKDENLVQLCANCHQAVERVYNKRFYRKLGVADRDKAPGKLIDELLEKCSSAKGSSVEAYERKYVSFPDRGEADTITREEFESLGFGEYAGYALGYYDAHQEIENRILGKGEDEPSE